jgi:hypothetical protein
VGVGVGEGGTATAAPDVPEIPPEVALITALPGPAAKKLPGGFVLGTTTSGLLVVQVVDGVSVISWVDVSLKVPTA